MLLNNSVLGKVIFDGSGNDLSLIMILIISKNLVENSQIFII